MHGITINIKAKTKNNPGMISAIFVMVPISIYTIWFIATHYSITTGEWIASLLLFPILLIVLLLIPLKVTMDKNSPYTYTFEELNRGNVPQKLNLKVRQ